ncbi:ATP-binding protein [Candidatus Peregrinibacteria bacterium]|nr:ATP-binding protein [Candidatus Peregrinibacteria bacterium]
MIKRSLQFDIELALKRFPVVSIIGSRQTGKTTLAKELLKKTGINGIYLDLELPSSLNKLSDPEIFLKEHEDKMIVIDEVQRMPGLFPLIRALVDEKNKNGRFLLLGSASPILLKHSSESLAGRIINFELTPFALCEVKSDYKSLWLKGGYPLSYLRSNEQSFLWRESFIQTHLERDIPQLGINIPGSTLRRFLSMISHVNGQLLNASNIAKSLSLSTPTIKHYLDIFDGTFILRSLQPYFVNIKKRLVKSPKIFFRDTGILHTLLNIRTYDDLLANPYLGNSWEAFVIEQIISQKSEGLRPYFYRSAAGAEIDLILDGNGLAPMAIEIKYSLSPSLSKGFQSGYNDLKCRKGVIIYPGKDKYQIGKDIFVLPVDRLSELFVK